MAEKCLKTAPRFDFAAFLIGANPVVRLLEKVTSCYQSDGSGESASQLI